MNKTLRVSVMLLGLALGLGLMALVGHSSRAGGALRKYKAELRSNGEKLTFEELTLSRGGDTNTNNSLAVLRTAVARLTNAPLPPSHLEPRQFVKPGRARVVWKDDTAFSNLPAPTEVQKDWAAFAAQMAKYDLALEEIRAAMKDPVLYSGPITNRMASRTSDYIKIRVAAQWLMGATLNELREHHLEQALRNLEAMLGVARMNREEYSLVTGMIRVAVASLAISVTWEALQAEGWTDSQLARLQKAWEAVDLVAGLEIGFLAERAFAEGNWAALHGASADATKLIGPIQSDRPRLEELAGNYLLFPAYKLTSINDDELLYLRAMQQNLESIRLIKTDRSWQEAKQKLDKTMAELNRITSSPGRIRYWFSLLLFPNFFRAIERGVQTETERQMTIAAIALQRSLLREGKPPSTLEALVPQFLSRLPRDPMSGKPLCYRPQTGSAFLLYSVGEDGRDDGGNPNAGLAGKPDIWAGPDAVWPWPDTQPQPPR